MQQTKTHSNGKSRFTATLLTLLLSSIAFASEADLAIPDLRAGTFHIFGYEVSSWNFLFWGAMVIAGTLAFSLILFRQVKRLPVHQSMSKVANTIYSTCRTYLAQQGKFLLMLFVLIAAVLCVYFFGLLGKSAGTVIQVLLFAVIGMAGSYSVAWYGIRINTYANARTAFSALRARPLDVVNIPLRAGMSVGLFLISLELVMMVAILLFVDRSIVGICFLGFAIGESLGASALRIAGGIFTKIADIGSDLMKIVFKVKEDDPRNPGVIADCTGDNAGDSVGPTADGFETYGVTGVALITFITLAVTEPEMQAKLIVWIFGMRFLMDFLSGCSFFINQGISKRLYANKKDFDFEAPLMRLLVIAAVLCISASFMMSKLLLGDLPDTTLWWKLAIIIGCGTLAALLIPEFTKLFTSAKSTHVKEIVTASKEGGSSLNILSGIVSGYFGAFWTGLLIVGLMTLAFVTSQMGLDGILGPHASIFAFGLVAFGFLCMGPVTIAVDSYGPVTDNAQSVFELSQIEQLPNIDQEIEKDFGFKPDFEKGKYFLESNDSAGNTFKATAKPVLIGTAVVGATTMIFSIILLLEKVGLLSLSLTDAPVILGLICGGAVVFWFSGASIQAVTTGAYRAVEFIKRTFNMNKTEADEKDSKQVVKICTQYAQKGMWNIFIALISLTLAFAFFDPNFFVAYLVSIAIFGLFQAIFMANAGGSWDNAKKIVEVELKEKDSPLHEAAVVGDTVGDPFKDTSSVSLNPIIKFSTLFGLLATEIAIEMKASGVEDYSMWIATPFLVLGLIFVWRSFYRMKIPMQK
ncbi:MAG: sodium-translocating pyrophosphatase [Bacteroidales bacterium]|jgi:K(+)-stimulated pyrophosphate-energized sodium pump|nr:sodium-translocating pyrophosphatase [Bacteroidales bacterium]